MRLSSVMVWFCIVSGVVLASSCPDCENPSPSACRRWGSGTAKFLWASSENPGSGVTLTTAACGTSTGESAVGYIFYAANAHSKTCQDGTPCSSDGYNPAGSFAIIHVSGSNEAYRQCLRLVLMSDHTDSKGNYDRSISISRTNCDTSIPMAGVGQGCMKIEADALSPAGGVKGGYFPITVKFYQRLSKPGAVDRYTLLTTASGSITVKVNDQRDVDPANFKPDLRDGSVFSKTQDIYRNYTQEGGQSLWKILYRYYQGPGMGCTIKDFWLGDISLIPSSETFSRVKFPGYAQMADPDAEYMARSGWHYDVSGQSQSASMQTMMAAPATSSSGKVMYYEMGNLGRIYYHSETPSNGIPRLRFVERCTASQALGQGTIEWTYVYNSQDRIQYIHNASYADPNNQPDPDSVVDATAYYGYDYSAGDSNDPVVKYYTRPSTSSSIWTEQRNWELEFDGEGRATKYRQGCTSGCGSSGAFENVEYYENYDDLITRQYNAADVTILENEYLTIDLGQYEPAGTVDIPDGDFEWLDVPVGQCLPMYKRPICWQTLSINPQAQICDLNGSQYLQFDNSTYEEYYQDLYPIGADTVHLLEADIRGHANQSSKTARVELVAIKGSFETTLAVIDANDVNLQAGGWIHFSAQFNSTDFPDLVYDPSRTENPYLQIRLSGQKTDVDNISLSTSIWVGGQSRPIIKTQKKLNPQTGQLTTVLTRDFDKDNFIVAERQFVSDNSCRYIRYKYADKSFSTLLEKTEYADLTTSTSVPSGSSYTTVYTADESNGVYLTCFPDGKRADVRQYDPVTNRIAQTYQLDRDNNAIALREQFEYTHTEETNPFFPDIVKISNVWLHKNINPNGGITDYDYYTDDKLKGLLKSKTGPLGDDGRLVTEYTYDGSRRLIQEIQRKQGTNTPIIRSTVWNYNPVTGYLDYVTITDGITTATTVYKYNDFGQVIRQVDPDGKATGKSYGTGGEVTSEFTLAANCDPNQPDASLMLISQIRYTYTADGQMERVGKVKAEGTFAYKADMNTAADWVFTRYEYYGDGKKKKTIEDFGTGRTNLTTEYFYNLQGEIEKVIYPGGKWVKTNRDGRGLVVSEQTGYDSQVVLETLYHYNANGDLEQQTNPDGTKILYTYDNFGRIKRTYKDSLTGPYSEKFYDDASNVIREIAVEEDGTILHDSRKSYNNQGRVFLERVCSEPNLVDNATDIMTWYNYDVAGNLVKTIREGLDCCDPNDISNTSDIITVYDYDGLGRKIQTTSPKNVVSTTQYSPAGRIEIVVDPVKESGDPNVVLFTTVNVYDAAGRLEKTTDPEGNYTVFVYNSLNQVIYQTIYDCNDLLNNPNDDYAVRQVRTEYDNLGNVIRQAVMREPDSGDEILEGYDLITDSVYDPNTGLLSQTISYYGYGQTPNTATTSYYYDDIGRKIQTIDPLGNEEIVHYSSSNPAQVEKTESIQRDEDDPENTSYAITTFFEYDDFGRVEKSILDEDGDGINEETDLTTGYTYDGLDRLKTQTANDGVITVYEYDSFGNVKTQIDDYIDGTPDVVHDRKTEYVYNRLNQLYQVRAYDPNETATDIQITTYEYDKHGNTTKIIYPDNQSAQFVYNCIDRLDAEIKRNGDWIGYWYDQLGRLTQVSDYDPNCPNSSASYTEAFVYDAAGSLKSASKEEDGDFVSCSTFTYNGFGLAESETAQYFDLDPVTTLWGYDGSGNLVGQSHHNSNLAYTHDGLGRIKTIVRNGDMIVGYSYYGNATKTITYPEPDIEEQYGYDDLGRTEEIHSIQDSSTLLDFAYSYDAVGNRQQEQYKHLSPNVYDKYYYNSLRQLEKAEYAQSSPFALHMNDGRLSIDDLALFASVWLETDEPSFRTNVRNLLTSLATEFTEGHRDNILDGINRISKNQITPVKSSSASSLQLTANNSSLKAIYSLSELGISTDKKLRSETVRDDSGNIIALIAYDSQDRMVLFTMYPDSGGKVAVITSYAEDGGLASNSIMTWDEAGSLVSRDTFSAAADTESVIPTRSEESVDSANSTSSVGWAMPTLMMAPAAPDASYEQFTYDHLGNRYQHRDKEGYTTTITHNAVNQYEHLHKPLMGEWAEDQYPAYDANGNLEDDGQNYTYSYDYRNRLVRVEDNDSNVIAQYTYDALGRRIAKIVSSSTTYFYYDTSNEVIAEYEDTNTEPAREFVYGNGLDEVLCMFLPEYEGNPDDWDAFLEFSEAWLSTTGQPEYKAQYDHNSNGKIDLADFAYFASVWDISSFHEPHFYYLHDAMGSVRGLIGGKFKRQSDREFYNYDVYGASTDTSAVKNPFRFAGYYYDAETGLYSLRARTYDPQKGRFIQFDPIGYADSMNLYEYCLSNPTNYADPLGLWTKEGMLREYEKRYGDKGKFMLLSLYSDEYCIQSRDYWLNDWDYEDENQVLGISDDWIDWLGNRINSDQEAAKQLHEALTDRYGRIFGDFLRCVSEKCTSLGAVNQDREFFDSQPIMTGLTETLDRQQVYGARLGSLAQNMTVDEAKMALVSAVGAKCARKLLDALEEAKQARAAKKLAKSAKRTGKLAEEAFENSKGVGKQPARLPPKGSAERKAIEAARQRGINTKKAQELANIRAGGKGSGVWTEAELQQIRKTGKFPNDVRWHHDPTVANRPDLADKPNVVRPVRGGTKGHLDAHGGDFRK